MGEPIYETIGRSYSATRGEDPRVAAQIWTALGDAARVVNVGAGTGSYEPPVCSVVAVEPSATMLSQRRPGAAPAVQGVAESLPFPSATFDAAMAVLTLHHWSDLSRGLGELRRVADRQVILFFEPLESVAFWVLDFFPEVAALSVEQQAPGVPELSTVLDVRDVQPVMVPADCRDGFGAAYWARPEAYLDPVVQAGSSAMSLLSDAARAAGTERLRDALESGAWDERYGHLRELDELDAGYRLAIAGT